MGFHLLGYQRTAAALENDADAVALQEEGYSVRNNHFIFTQPWNILAAVAMSATLNRARLDVAKLNGFGVHEIWPLGVAATPPTVFRGADYRNFPLAIPLDEELGVRTSVGAAEVAKAALFIAGPGWNRNLPRGQQRLTVRFTGAVAGVQDVWSAFGAITLTQALRGGVYSVVGCQVFDAGVIAFRLSFPTPPRYSGKILRPGGIAVNAIADLPWEAQMGGFGEWGRFENLELPQIQIWANATGASVQDGRLDLIYHGENASLDIGSN